MQLQMLKQKRKKFTYTLSCMGIIAISFLLSLTFIAKKELMHGFDS
jgi:hypothetical protein